jgi:hypothetical protein
MPAEVTVLPSTGGRVILDRKNPFNFTLEGEV